MANRKTFSDFATKLNLNPSDYLVGYDHDGVGGEKKFPASHLKNFVNISDIVEITTDITLPVNQVPTDDDSPPIPNLNGKVFHVNPIPPENIEITLPQLSPEQRVRFEIVNLMDANHVRIVTNVGTFMAKGDLLSRKYHTATVYYDGTSWHGFGDLMGTGAAGSLKIKDITGDYRFVVADVDTILHFDVSEDTVVTLPDPVGITSGLQFYITNLSESVISLVAENSELKAKATKLRRQFDDAVVYTDGKSWFATGDLL